MLPTSLARYLFELGFRSTPSCGYATSVRARHTALTARSARSYVTLDHFRRGVVLLEEDERLPLTSVVGVYVHA